MTDNQSVIIIRLATPSDAAAILAIYAPYILESSITFEYEVPTVDEFIERMKAIQQQFPYLVAEVDGRILGYSYAARHRDRAAYQWSVETSVYVRPDGHRRGIARQLYTTLIDYLRRQGYYSAYAGMTLPNPKSEALHRTMGFKLVGTYQNVGYKMGAWHSVAWFERTLQPHQANPPVPVSINEL